VDAKPLWSPLVERSARARTGSAARCSRWRGARRDRAAPANPIGAALSAALAFYCIASATQDIAIDAYTIGLVDRGARVPRTPCARPPIRVGLALSGSGLLLLPARIGWPSVRRRGGAHAAFAASLALTPAIRAAAPPSAGRCTRCARGWSPARFPVARVRDPVPDRRPRDGTDAADVLGRARVQRREIALLAKPARRGRDDRRRDRGRRVGRARGMIPALWGTGRARACLEPRLSAAAAWPESGRIGVYSAPLVER
jgi:hypothetical protein